jgi:hypothetical protein
MNRRRSTSRLPREIDQPTIRAPTAPRAARRQDRRQAHVHSAAVTVPVRPHRHSVIDPHPGEYIAICFGPVGHDPDVPAEMADHRRARPRRQPASTTAKAQRILTRTSSTT